jgi:hypothetical protein
VVTDTSEYEMIFQCPVYFEKQANSLVFDSLIIILPITMLNIFDKIAQETLESLGLFEASVFHRAFKK